MKPALVVLALSSLLAACAGNGAGVATVGQPAPGWTEPMVPSGTLSLAALRGKAVYLNFFASWCPPCNAEAPSIEALQKRYAAQGLRVVGIDELENARQAELFRSEHDLHYAIVVDSGTIGRQYRVNGLPVHVFIDPKGIVRKIVVGELSPVQMRQDVAAILQ